MPINCGLQEYVGLNIPLQKEEKSEPEKTHLLLPDEPVYVNYQTIDDYVRAESFGDTTGTSENILEFSIASQSVNPKSENPKIPGFFGISGIF